VDRGDAERVSHVKRLAIAGAVAALAIAAIWIWRASRSPAAGGSAEPTDAPGGERSGVARSRGEAPRLDDPAATPGASADQPDDPRAVRRDRGLEPAEVFEAEPRVEPWASAREKGVSRIVGRALGHVSSELSVEAVECRRGTCRESRSITPRGAIRSARSRFRSWARRRRPRLAKTAAALTSICFLAPRCATTRPTATGTACGAPAGSSDRRHRQPVDGRSQPPEKPELCEPACELLTTACPAAVDEADVEILRGCIGDCLRDAPSRICLDPPMRRWRTFDDRFLVEAPGLGPAQYYKLGRDLAVERVFKKETSRLGDEIHKISYDMIGGQLMCRHIVEHVRRPNEDRSSVELDKLEPLIPDDSPTEKQAREAIAVFEAGAEAVEAARREQITRLTGAAPESVRDLVGRLAERAVRDDDKLSRSMMAALAAVARLSRGGSVDPKSMRAATEAIGLAGRLMTGDPAVRDARLPTLSGEALSVISRLDELAGALEKAARTGDNYSSDTGSAAAAGYRNAAAVLRVAVFHLRAGVKVE
jgi:hypothetical protein